jgi:hypothetical protein
VHRSGSRTRRSIRLGVVVALFTLLALAPASGLRELPPPPDPGWPEVHIEGPPVATAGVARALARVFATRVGTRVRERLMSGALPEPLTIVLNAKHDNLTLYRVAGRELSQTILFDPAAFPLVETEAGTRSAWAETVLAHELGHAVFQLISEEDVIREVENPVRAELGLPLRTRF